MRRLLLVIAFCLCGCGPTENAHTEATPAQGTADSSDPAAHPAFQASGDVVRYELHQRRGDNNHWDDGRPLDPSVGEEIFEIASRATEFDIRKLGPVSIGVMGPHYRPPPYVIQVSRTDAAGTTDRIILSRGLALFTVGGGDYQTFAVRDGDTRRLVELVSAARDPTMAPVK